MVDVMIVDYLERMVNEEARQRHTVSKVAMILLPPLYKTNYIPFSASNFKLNTSSSDMP